MKRIDFLRGAVALGATAGCARRDGAIAIGSKDFTESTLIGEMYAQLLESHGVPVRRRLGLGTTQVATAALRKGEIDLYPEYTGTALLVVLGAPLIRDDAAAYAFVAREYRRRFDLTWLRPAPMNNSQALAVASATAAREGLRTIADLARVADRLRLGATPEFMQRADGFPALRRAYGDFRFKEVEMLDIGVKYRALLAGDVDAVVAFGTDGRLVSDAVRVLGDPRRAWAGYHVAPVVRSPALAAHPTLGPLLDRLAPHLTDAAMRRANAAVDGDKRDVADVAREFLRAAALVRAA